MKISILLDGTTKGNTITISNDQIDGSDYVELWSHRGGLSTEALIVPIDELHAALEAFLVLRKQQMERDILFRKNETT